MSQGGVSGYEVTPVLNEMVETEVETETDLIVIAHAYNEEREAVETAYTYQRADGTVEHAASTEDAISRCPVLGELALKSPEQAKALLSLVAVPDRLSAAEQTRPAEDAKTRDAMTTRSTGSKLPTHEAENVALAVTGKLDASIPELSGLQLAHPEQTYGDQPRVELPLVLGEEEILREIQSAQIQREAIAPDRSASNLKVDDRRPKTVVMGKHRINTAEPVKAPRPAKTSTAVTKIINTARKTAAPAPPKSVKAGASLRREKVTQTAAQTRITLPRFKSRPASQVPASTETAAIDTRASTAGREPVEKKAPKPVLIETESALVAASLPESKDTAGWERADLAMATEQHIDAPSPENSFDMRVEGDEIPETGPQMVVETHLEMEDPGSAQAESARELINDLTLMIKEYRRLPEVAVEEQEVLEKVIVQLSRQLLTSVGEDYDEEAIRQFIYEITRASETTKIENDSQQFDQYYLNRMGTHEYKALDQSSTLGSLTGFIKQKLQLHLELARYTVQACLA